MDEIHPDANEKAEATILLPIPQLLAAVIEKAKKQPGCDQELIEILEAHIVTETPKINAVSETLTAIKTLAANRASEKNPDDEQDNN